MYIEAKTPVGKTIMSLFFSVMALIGLIGAVDDNTGQRGGAFVVFLAFGVMAVLGWRNTLAHQRYLQDKAQQE